MLRRGSPFVFTPRPCQMRPSHANTLPAGTSTCTDISRGGGLIWYSGRHRWLPGTTCVLPLAGVKSSSSQNRLQAAGNCAMAGT